MGFFKDMDDLNNTLNIWASEFCNSSEEFLTLFYGKVNLLLNDVNITGEFTKEELIEYIMED